MLIPYKDPLQVLINKNRLVYAEIVLDKGFLSKYPHKKSIFLLSENKNTPILHLHFRSPVIRG